jgi:hypothetical protein
MEIRPLLDTSHFLQPLARQEDERVKKTCAWTFFGTSVAKSESEGKMKVKFTLSMDDLIVSGRHYDQVVLDWEEDMVEEEVLALSQSWISTQNFLINRMNGLSRVGESSLTIEPLEKTDQSPKGKKSAGRNK